MKSLWVLFKIEVKLGLREGSGILFAIILPVGLMLLLGVIFGDKPADENVNYTMLQQSYAAVITLGICATGLMGLPTTISGYREKKILKRFVVTPTSPVTLLGAQFLNSFLFAIVSSVLVTIIAVLFFGYTMIGSIGLFTVIYLLVVVAIYAIGMLIASVSSSVKMVNLLASLVYFPTFFLSGATVPYEIMPRGLQIFSNILPLTHGIKVLKGISLGYDIGQFTFSIILLSAIAVVCTIVAIKTFRYEY